MDSITVSLKQVQLHRLAWNAGNFYENVSDVRMDVVYFTRRTQRAINYHYCLFYKHKPPLSMLLFPGGQVHLYPPGMLVQLWLQIVGKSVHSSMSKEEEE